MDGEARVHTEPRVGVQEQEHLAAGGGGAGAELSSDTTFDPTGDSTSDPSLAPWLTPLRGADQAGDLGGPVVASAINHDHLIGDSPGSGDGLRDPACLPVSGNDGRQPHFQDPRAPPPLRPVATGTLSGFDLYAGACFSARKRV